MGILVAWMERKSLPPSCTHWLLLISWANSRWLGSREAKTYRRRDLKSTWMSSTSCGGLQTQLMLHILRLSLSVILRTKLWNTRINLGLFQLHNFSFFSHWIENILIYFYFHFYQHSAKESTDDQTDEHNTASTPNPSSSRQISSTNNASNKLQRANCSGRFNLNNIIDDDELISLL